jgi:FMN phosphatase YigB (HAD superfamily)
VRDRGASEGHAQEGEQRDPSMTDDLSGHVIAFDLDNTLIEFEADAYERIVRRFLADGDLGLGDVEPFGLYEKVRAWGNAMERIGLANPVHRRGHPHLLAMIGLLFGELPFTGAARLPESRRRATIDLMMELTDRERASRHGEPADCLLAELELRATLVRSQRLADLAQRVRQLADSPELAEWAARYPAIEREFPLKPFDELLNALEARGASCVIITHGLVETQLAKVQRLGLLDRFRERVLITENAGAVAGRLGLEEALDERLHDCVSGRSAPDEDLGEMWLFRWVLQQWARKTPSFYARCLHAIRARPDRPGVALAELAVVRPADWAASPLAFAMVGDRHDLDVRPLRALLKPGQGQALLLAQGKYGPQHGAYETDERHRPDGVFPDWACLEEFLEGDGVRRGAAPIAAAPDCFAEMPIPQERLMQGRRSRFQAIRLVADVAERSKS